MSFADWKKNSALYESNIDRANRQGVSLKECCQAAYKAGERQGRKDVEVIAIQAIKMRELNHAAE